jgi:hypothetical protein
MVLHLQTKGQTRRDPIPCAQNFATTQTAAVETRCSTIAGCKPDAADSETTQAGAIAAKAKLACALSARRHR